MFLVLVVLLLYVAWSMFRSVPQATVGVVTVFGKYRRIMREGLNIKLPWEKVAYRCRCRTARFNWSFRPSPRIRRT